MFETKISCPVAITDEHGATENKGEAKATEWALQHMEPGNRLTMWVPLKSVINNNRFLPVLASQRGVEVVTGRGMSFFRASGPVVGFYVNREELSQFNGVPGMTALSLVTSRDCLNVWGEEVGAEVLFRDEDNEYMSEASPLSAIAREELEYVTKLINTNNTLSTHFEKKHTVEALKRLKAKGELPDPKSAIEWAAALGWRNDNPKILGEWVEKLHAGKTLRY